jgi:peptidoglycan/xylan/chitin deacetylase (PgdA/CDA1 family)
MRSDLIEYLLSSPDEIAFHGLYHTDHSTMSLSELRSEMTEGLEILRRIFPSKPIRYFIAPFNRTSALTYQVAGELGLRVLAMDGVHMEAALANLRLEPRTWYRYHHHRFYPESKFPHFNLSLEALDAAFSRQSKKNLN